jgi:hypothetical protein
VKSIISTGNSNFSNGSNLTGAVVSFVEQDDGEGSILEYAAVIVAILAILCLSIRHLYPSITTLQSYDPKKYSLDKKIRRSKITKFQGFVVVTKMKLYFYKIAFILVSFSQAILLAVLLLANFYIFYSGVGDDKNLLLELLYLFSIAVCGIIALLEIATVNQLYPILNHLLSHFYNGRNESVVEMTRRKAGYYRALLGLPKGVFQLIILLEIIALNLISLLITSYEPIIYMDLFFLIVMLFLDNVLYPRRLLWIKITLKTKLYAVLSILCFIAYPIFGVYYFKDYFSVMIFLIVFGSSAYFTSSYIVRRKDPQPISFWRKELYWAAGAVHLVCILWIIFNSIFRFGVNIPDIWNFLLLDCGIVITVVLSGILHVGLGYTYSSVLCNCQLASYEYAEACQDQKIQERTQTEN